MREDLLEEARAWLLWAGANPETVPEMAAPTVRTLVDWHYPGGWWAFAFGDL